jgi:hypothetical protein
MKWIINLVGKYSGLSMVWDKMNGYKTKIGGVALVLSGLAGILAQLAAMSFDTASVLAFVKGISTDPSFLVLLNGLAVLGIGHKIEKATK